MSGDKIQYDWNEINSNIGVLARRIKNSKLEIKNIFGVPRGGLVAAVMLSYRLDIPLIYKKEDIKMDTLVVDDICDSGETLAELQKEFKFGNAAVIIRKGGAKFFPTFSAKEVAGSAWIIFPWETKRSSKLDKTKF